MKTYFFLNHKGECSLPSWSEVKDTDLSSKPYVLIPDNNVCIHVSDFNTHKQDKIKKEKARNFRDYVFKSNINVNPTYGLLERASKPGTLNLNTNKLGDFEDVFWRQLYRYVDNKILSSTIESIDFLKSRLYPFYAYLLKIKLILSKREPSSKNAETNIKELYDFTKEIKIHLAIPWQFALAIFGGNNKLNKLISSGKKGNMFKALWGAAWDLLYIQEIHQYNGVREINNSYPQYILVTDDKSCAAIGSMLAVFGALDYGNVIYNQTLINHDFPHWNHKGRFLFDLSQEINKHVSR